MDTTDKALEVCERLAQRLEAYAQDLRYYGTSDALDTVLDDLNELRVNGYYERQLDKLRENEGGN